jgi:hypothetical protein
VITVQVRRGNCSHHIVVRLIDLYLLVYYGLIAGALYTLYVSGVLVRLSLRWTVWGAVVAVGLGVLLRLLSGRPRRRPKKNGPTGGELNK